MPQTVLAILAMIVATLMGLQQQRGAVHRQMHQIRNELSMQSTAVAEDLIRAIGSKAFDQATADLGEGQTITSPAALTHPSQFGPYDTPDDDIDDFHGSVGEEYKARAIRVVNTESGEVRDDTLRFAVDVRVSYADEINVESVQTQRSKVKKVTVTVY